MVEPARADRSGTVRSRTLWLLAVAVVFAATVFGLVKLPEGKIIESPGPTWDVLSRTEGSPGQAGTDLITVSGAPTYATSGQMRMTTVSVSGCPGHPITAFDVIGAWLSSDKKVLNREQVCPATLTQQDIDKQSQAQMTSSQDAAVVAALMESGAATSMTLTIKGSVSAQTQGLFQDGDVLREVTMDGVTTKITTFNQLRELLAKTPVGTKAVLGIERGGQPSTVEVTTQAPQDQGRSGSVLGVFLNAKADSEVDATFALQDVGGPSAGMVFALGIVDKLTPGPMLTGQDVAGTGTIDIAGNVGPIGGIAQKMRGAARDGATVFLAPAANCNEVVGNEPSGMQVVAVSNLHEAVEAATAIGRKQTEGLKTCQAVLAQS
ncbi:YlbL family protein [Actinomyces trachealis]|uniref:YlbL family protein n=1 Tax=Actinomyces trachealis TaxID=2763540 RepID=UPI0018C7437F|nr:S16 family serine protease [Actinomyces trachealis]